jgi:hypothetical protein
MIISDTHRFAFVHIPKCAGTTLRNALLPFDEHADRFYDKAVAPHPALHRLDHHHIPLAVLRDHFPADYEKLTAYRSFALVRDPFSRFPSSLHERLVQRDRRPLSVRDASEIAHEIDTVLAHLARQPSGTPISDPELIHFSRQCDYIFLDGRQIIDTPRTIAEVEEVFEAIEGIVDAKLKREEKVMNRQVRYASPAVRQFLLAVTGPIERVVPRSVWKPAYRPIKKLFLAAGLMSHGGTDLSELPNANEIRAFVAEFYAGDIELFRMLDAERRRRFGTEAENASSITAS